MKKINFTITILFLYTNIFAQKLPDLIPFHDIKNEKYGYADTLGNIKINCIYNYSSCFVNNYAVVSISDTQTVQRRFRKKQSKEYNESSEDVIIEKYFLINKNATVIGELKSSNINNSFAIKTKDTWNYMNNNGKLLTNINATNAEANFKNNIAIIQIDSGYYFINNKNFLLSKKYDSIQRLDEGFIVKESNAYGLLDCELKTVAPTIYNYSYFITTDEYISELRMDKKPDGYIALLKNWYINNNKICAKSEIINNHYYACKYILQNNNYKRLIAYFNDKNIQITPFMFNDDVSNFCNGFAIAYLKTDPVMTYLIDKYGKLQILKNEKNELLLGNIQSEYAFTSNFLYNKELYQFNTLNGLEKNNKILGNNAIKLGNFKIISIENSPGFYTIYYKNKILKSNYYIETFKPVSNNLLYINSYLIDKYGMEYHN